MKSWLFVEFADQMEEAARWVSQAPKGQTRKLLAVRKEVEEGLQNKKIEHEALSSIGLQPKDYEELDRLSRDYARTWNERAGCPKAQWEGKDLADLYYSQMSIYFYWVLRSALSLDLWFLG